jgi:hypothetical protein
MNRYTKQFDNVQLAEMTRLFFQQYGTSDLGTIIACANIDLLDHIKGLERRIVALEQKKKPWLGGAK